MQNDNHSRVVIWSEASRSDLEDIRSYINQSGPLAAQRFILRLITSVESLADQPLRGHTAKRNVRELVVSPYIIRYQVQGSAVRIVRIKHGARRPD